MYKLLTRWWVALLCMLPVTGCGQQITVLHPQGPVARKEYGMIIWSSAFLLIVVIVVFYIFVWVLFKYRANRPNLDDYEPDLGGKASWEATWTILPIVMVIALAIPTVRTTYALEHVPTDRRPLVINVTSANWKWIFQYPEQGITTVNYVEIPADRPVRFMLSAVGPMNSFWVPALGGQEYAMTGMNAEIWLEADKPGEYYGRSANFSGVGFAHMEFRVISLTQSDFDHWVGHVKQTEAPLTQKVYEKILEPGLVPRMTFSTQRS